MKDSKIPGMKTYEEYLSEGRGKINTIMDKVLMIFIITGPALLVGKLAGVFTSISYHHIALIFVFTVVIAIVHHLVIEKTKISKNAGILLLLSLDSLLIGMANAHVGIYVTLFLVPMVSIIYYSKPIYFAACAMNYVTTVIIAWTTSDFYSAMDLRYPNDRVGWFLNRISGYTIESFLMMAMGFFVVTTIIDHSKKLYLSIRENNLDNMTGILNRKAFENDKAAIKVNSLSRDLILFYIDINSLKSVNDDMGHLSGDELINGAALCITEVLGKYGKIYRVGGDEFVSIVFTDVPAQQLVDELHERVMSWSGKTVESLKLSIGYASVREGHAPTFEGLENVAEQAMYADKRRFYSESDFDRRKNR